MGITQTLIKAKFRMQPCTDSNGAAAKEYVRQNELTDSLTKEMEMLFSEYLWSQRFYTPKMKKQKLYLQHHKALTRYPPRVFVGD